MPASHTDYQLMSWSKDRTLRVWGISEQLREDIGVVSSLTSPREDGDEVAMEGAEASPVSWTVGKDETDVEQSGKHGQDV